MSAYLSSQSVAPLGLRFFTNAHQGLAPLATRCRPSGTLASLVRR